MRNVLNTKEIDANNKEFNKFFNNMKKNLLIKGYTVKKYC